MKTKNILVAFISLTLMVLNVSAVYVVDGSLSDWGVTPFVDWIPDSPTADYKEEDYNGTNPEPGNPPTPYSTEIFDIEALYFDDYYDNSLGGMAYFASVISMGPNGYGSYMVGDLALDTDNNPSTGKYGYEYGIKLTGPNKGQVCYMPDWQKPKTGGIPGNAPSIFYCNGSNSVIKGTAQIAYVDTGIRDYPVGCTNNTYNCQPNYVIEVGVKKTLIGLPEKGETSKLHITHNCGNDAIDIVIDWDYPLPEFVSALVPVIIIFVVPAVAYGIVKFKINK